MRGKIALIIFAVIYSGTVPAVEPLKDNTLLWAGCGITKKAFMAELAKGFEKKYGIKVRLSGGGATKGIRKAANGEIDIGGACRTSIERNPLERKAYLVPVAWDALTVIAHKENRVESLSFQQIQGIYLGKIKNWKELGGRDAPIELYVRKGKLSGVGRTLRELVFADFNQEFPSATHIVKSSGPLEKGIEKNLNGIGITGVSSAKRRIVKILKLEDKSPSFEHIKKGEYLLYRPLYLVTQGERAHPMAKKFITYALSREGKEIIRKAGTVPYADALGLVMKQVDQYERATAKGLYR